MTFKYWPFNYQTISNHFGDSVIWIPTVFEKFETVLIILIPGSKMEIDNYSEDLNTVTI